MFTKDLFVAHKCRGTALEAGKDILKDKYKVHIQDEAYLFLVFGHILYSMVPELKGLFSLLGERI